MMRIKFNEKRATQVFSILNDLWTKKAEIFEKVVLSQNRWPMPQDPKDRANYLFYAALPMRGAVVSDDPFKIFWALYQKRPAIFKPEVVAKQFTQRTIVYEIKEIARELKFKEVLKRDKENNGNETTEVNGEGGAIGYKLEEHAEHWYKNSVALADYWDGSVLNVFKYGVVDYEDAFRRIDWKTTKAGFFGMRRKIFALLTIWLQGEGLIPVFPTPLPVDFHTLRILWATECITFPKNTNPPTALKEYYEPLVGKPTIRISETLQDIITLWSQKFLVQKGFSHLDINPAIWVVSRDFCQGHFQNTSREKGSVFFTAEKLELNPALWPKNYRDPCNYCPLEHLCSGAIPANPYFRRGIMVRMERMPYHSPLLPGIKQYITYSGRRRSVPNNNKSPPS